MTHDSGFSIFEYFYRDGGNYKTHGSVLLAGRATPADEVAVRASLDDACFVAEQVGVAPLQPQHLQDCGAAGELDHGFHEFAALRTGEADDAGGTVAGMTVGELVRRFQEAAGRWDPGRSPFGR